MGDHAQGKAGAHFEPGPGRGEQVCSELACSTRNFGGLVTSLAGHLLPDMFSFKMLLICLNHELLSEERLSGLWWDGLRGAHIMLLTSS